MRRVLGAVLLTTVLALTAAGCGEDDGTADDTGPAPASTPTSTEQPHAADLDFELVEMITETAAGGEVGSAAVISDPASLTPFLAQFQPKALPGRLQDALAVTPAPDGMVVYAAVVAIGCDSPNDVTVTPSEKGLQVEAVPVADPLPECLAPMTTVAVLLVPADAVA